MASIEAKTEIEAIEVVGIDPVLYELPLPEQIAHLGSDELLSLENRLVRRLDIFLLPTCALLFLMNILDR